MRHVEVRAIRPLTCDNETDRRGAGNASTVLTHLSDLGGRGLGVSLPSEEWRPIPGFEGRYEVSDHGRVMSYVPHRKPRLMTPDRRSTGHRFIHMCQNAKPYTVAVHRLVLLAFVGEPESGQMCRHLNGDPADNRLSNLAWGTNSENQIDSIRHGTHRQTRKTHCPKGHAYDEANTLIRKRGPGRPLSRDCRACNNERFRQMRERRRTA